MSICLHSTQNLLRSFFLSSIFCGKNTIESGAGAALFLRIDKISPKVSLSSSSESTDNQIFIPRETQFCTSTFHDPSG